MHKGQTDIGTFDFTYYYASFKNFKNQIGILGTRFN